jgi:hypothetical protein
MIGSLLLATHGLANRFGDRLGQLLIPFGDFSHFVTKKPRTMPGLLSLRDLAEISTWRRPRHPS